MVDSVSVRFKNARVEKMPLTFVCSGMRNRLRVGVRAKKPGVSGFACRPF